MKIVLDKGAQMPVRAHTYDGGMDLVANESRVVHAKDWENIDTGVHVQIPEGCVGFIKSRSGMMSKHGILTDGTIDCGYTGAIRVSLFNMSNTDYPVQQGDRIAQLVIVPCVLVPGEQVKKLERTVRGSKGFGSTGR